MAPASGSAGQAEAVSLPHLVSYLSRSGHRVLSASMSGKRGPDGCMGGGWSNIASDDQEGAGPVA